MSHAVALQPGHLLFGFRFSADSYFAAFSA